LDPILASFGPVLVQVLNPKSKTNPDKLYPNTNKSKAQRPQTL